MYLCARLLLVPLGFFFLFVAKAGFCSSPKNIEETILAASGTIFCDGFVRGSGLHIYRSARQHSIIITAAHVIFDESSKGLFERCSYRPNNMRLQEVPFADISTYGYSPYDLDTVKQSETDLAFVALTRKLYQSAFHLSTKRTNVKRVDPSQTLRIIAYNSTTNQIEVSKACESIESPNFTNKSLILHNCPAGPGSSGALIIDTNDNRLIGIHGGTLLIHKEILSSGKSNSISRLRQGRIIDAEVVAAFEKFRSDAL